VNRRDFQLIQEIVKSYNSGNYDRLIRVLYNIETSPRIVEKLQKLRGLIQKLVYLELKRRKMLEDIRHEPSSIEKISREMRYTQEELRGRLRELAGNSVRKILRKYTPNRKIIEFL
ncbi:MAG: hypothetical protein J7L39_00695, partial [Candidatus Aenigmarchaeota archaeon]|nr:hypothetical protein [Candidatus Aenigmarchaeota archaeon]